MRGLLLNIFLFCLFVFISGEVKARQDSSKTQIEKQLEEVLEELENEEVELTGELLVQFLEELTVNPININTAEINELLQIPGFNLKTARSVINYRASQPFETKDELLKVPGIGQATYERVKFYVTVGGRKTRFQEFYTNPNYWLQNNSFEYITRFQQTLQQQRGYELADSSGGYIGNPSKYYQRLRMLSRHLSVNLTQEKDPGESLKGVNDFDFVSGHIALIENGSLKKLVIGDYGVNLGQGLLLWTGGAFGKGREVIGATGRNERGIRPYTSAQETDFLRGAAATFGEKVETTIFYSNRNRTSSIINQDTVRFPSSSGFHRTESETDRRNNVNQQISGGRTRISSQIGILGFTGYWTEFSNYIGKGDRVNNLYDFEGKTNSVISTDFRVLIRDVLFFGEVARSKNGGLGLVSGFESPIGVDTELTILYRNYGKDFQSFLGNGFGESSSAPKNEEGLYIGVKQALNQKVSVSVYSDQYQFKAPTFSINQSSSGFDVLGLIEYKFSKTLLFYMLLRNETKDDVFSEINERGEELMFIGQQKRSSMRVQAEYQWNSKIRLRSRVELVHTSNASGQKEQGFLMYQDVRLTPFQNLKFDARVTLFDTYSFYSRVFQFENDLLHVLSNTALFGRGQRLYLVVNYKVFDFLDFWLKYSQTIFEDTHFISSGLNQIQGNIKSDIGVQARLKL